MIKVRHKILSGFPCNNNSFYVVYTEDYGKLVTSVKETFDKAMKDGYIELEHEDYYCKENVL